jgi:hypothetical protein
MTPGLETFPPRPFSLFVKKLHLATPKPTRTDRLPRPYNTMGNAAMVEQSAVRCTTGKTASLSHNYGFRKIGYWQKA